MAALFKFVQDSLDHGKAPERPGTIQWDFADAEPWHLLVPNGDTRVAPGRVGADGDAEVLATRTGRT